MRNKTFRTPLAVAYFTTVFLGYSCNQQKEEYIVNIPAIANKHLPEVTEILGKPDTTYVEKRGKKQVDVLLYNPHKIEIYFPDGKATEIVVNEPMPLPYHENSLGQFNIIPQSPNDGNTNAALKWSNIEGFRYINFFATGYNGDRITSYKMFFNIEEEK